MCLILFGCTNTDQQNMPQANPSLTEFKDYSNATLGFSIKYPSDWVVKENYPVQGTIDFASTTDNVDLGLNYIEIGGPLTFPTVDSENEYLTYALSQSLAMKNCSIVKTIPSYALTLGKAIPAYKSEFSCINGSLETKGFMLLVLADNISYTISFTTPSDKVVKYSFIVDTMLNSFKVDRNDFDGVYTRYTDKVNKIITRYPYSWVINQNPNEKTKLAVSSLDNNISFIVQIIPIPADKPTDLNGYNQFVKNSLTTNLNGTITGEMETTTQVDNTTIPAIKLTADYPVDDITAKAIYKYFIYNNKIYVLLFTSPEDAYIENRGTGLDMINFVKLIN